MPDLLVEIVSDTTRRMDEIVKLRLYERFGVREYWVVDPILDTIKIYRWVDLVFTKGPSSPPRPATGSPRPSSQVSRSPYPRSSSNRSRSRSLAAACTTSHPIFRLTRWMVAGSEAGPGRRLLKYVGHEDGIHGTHR